MARITAPRKCRVAASCPASVTQATRRSPCRAVPATGVYVWTLVFFCS